MNEENTKILVESFPELYGTNFHFECDDGWFRIVYGLSSAIDFGRKLFAKNNIVMLGISKDAIDDTVLNNIMDAEFQNYDYRIFQIKEKYGSLRCYTNNNVDPITTDIITQYERISGTICETCGSDNARTKTSKWRIKSLCENCCEEHNKVVAKIAKSL